MKSVWMIDPGVKVDEGYSVYDGGLTHIAGHFSCMLKSQPHLLKNKNKE